MGSRKELTERFVFGETTIEDEQEIVAILSEADKPESSLHSTADVNKTGDSVAIDKLVEGGYRVDESGNLPRLIGPGGLEMIYAYGGDTHIAKQTADLLNSLSGRIKGLLGKWNAEIDKREALAEKLESLTADKPVTSVTAAGSDEPVYIKYVDAFGPLQDEVKSLTSRVNELKKVNHSLEGDMHDMERLHNLCFSMALYEVEGERTTDCIARVVCSLTSQVTALTADRDRLRGACKIVDEQAKDDALWLITSNIEIAYFQQELRRLHEALEGKTSEECARQLLAPQDKGSK